MISRASAVTVRLVYRYCRALHRGSSSPLGSTPPDQATERECLTYDARFDTSQGPEPYEWVHANVLDKEALLSVCSPVCQGLPWWLY